MVEEFLRGWLRLHARVEGRGRWVADFAIANDQYIYLCGMERFMTLFVHTGIPSDRQRQVTLSSLPRQVGRATRRDRSKSIKCRQRAAQIS